MHDATHLGVRSLLQRHGRRSNGDKLAQTPARMGILDSDRAQAPAGLPARNEDRTLANGYGDLIMSDSDTVKLLKFLEAEQIEARFWFRPGEWIVGIPRYVGFDTDIGELFSISGSNVAAHDFRAFVIPNKDNHRYRDLHAVLPQ